MKYNFLSCSIFACIFAVVLCLPSCYLWENQDSHNTTIWTSFQITNNSSRNVTLRFKREGQLFRPYAEIYNQSEIIALTVGKTEKAIESLLHTTELQLNPGQTILFYEPTNTGDSRYPAATSLMIYGYGPSLSPMRYVARNILGDSIIVSMNGLPYDTLSSSNESFWETWYDEKQYIYYHAGDIR